MKKDKLDGKKLVYKSDALKIHVGSYEYNMIRVARISNGGVGMSGQPTYLDLDGMDLSLVADELAAASAAIRLLSRKLGSVKIPKVGKDDDYE